MKNKLNFFNRGLYIEGLKQLRLPGIFFTVILALYSIFAPLSSIGEKLYINDIEINPMFYLCWIFMIPLMTEVLFKFLNKRNSSDFYHAIPVRRTTLIASYSLSILTWTVFVIAVNILVFYITGKICCSRFEFRSTDIAIYVLNTIILAFYIHACFMLAKSITGTKFTNLIVVFLIIFVPRLCIFVISRTVYNLNFMTADLPALLNPSNNLVIGMFCDMFFITGSTGDSILSLRYGIYTLVLALIYFALAMIAFNKRSSETAACAAPSRTISGIYKILLTYSITLIPLNFSVESFFTNDTFFDIVADDLVSMLFFYVFAIIVYYGYEGITSKSIVKSFKASKGLLVVLALNVITIAICFAGVMKVRSFTPTKDEIDSISLVNYDAVVTNRYSREMEYSDYVKLNTKLTDIEIITIVSRQLKKQTEDYNFVYKHRSSGIRLTPYYTIIRSGGKEYKRRIYFPSERIDLINDAFQNSEAYIENYCNLPDYPGAANLRMSVLNGTNNYISYLDLSTSETKRLYNSIKNEIKEYSGRKVKNSIIISHDSSDDSDISYDAETSTTINTYMTINDKTVIFEVNLSELPKSKQLFDSFSK